MSWMGSFVSRVWNSSVVWFWGSNGLRLASGLLLLPLLTRLAEPELGFYYVLVSILALAPLLDAGMMASIDRAIWYIMGGAQEVQAIGTPQQSTNESPNYVLLWKLLKTTQQLYRGLTVLLLVVLGPFSVAVVYGRIDETPNPGQAWLALGITLLAALLEVYTGWWNIFLRGMNRVLDYARIGMIAQFLKLFLSCILLLMDWGLLAVPLATVFSSMVQRALSRMRCLQILAPYPKPSLSREELFALLKKLWPNSWRNGLHLFGWYLGTYANTMICARLLGLNVNAQYGLSQQILNVIVGMSLAWTGTKWPLLGQLRAKRDLDTLSKIFRQRLWLQICTYPALAAVAVPISSILLEWLGTNKTVLPHPWFAFLALQIFLDMHLTTWTALIVTENRLPFVWASLFSNAGSMVLAVVLIKFGGLGIAGLIIAPLIAGAVLNYWYWPLVGSRGLETGWFRFMFHGRDQPQGQA